MHKKISILTAMAFLSGCATSGPSFSNAPHLAQGGSGVYVYRTKHFLSGFGATIYVDNKPLGIVHDNGYLFKKLSPGVHTVSVKNSSGLFSTSLTSQKFTLEPGTVKYIKVEWETNGHFHTMSGGTTFHDFAWALQLIHASVAKNELVSLRY